MDIIEFFLTLQNQLKVYHWQTNSYAQHKAFDQAYEEMEELVDKFMEVYMGKYGRIMAEGKFNTSCVNYSPKIKDNIKFFINGLQGDLVASLSKGDTDLLNIRDEMLGALNQLMYLLTLE